MIATTTSLGEPVLRREMSRVSGSRWENGLRWTSINDRLQLEGRWIVRTAEDCVSICNEAGIAGTSVPHTGTVKGV
jgi:hypothetical protein